MLCRLLQCDSLLLARVVTAMIIIYIHAISFLYHLTANADLSSRVIVAV